MDNKSYHSDVLKNFTIYYTDSDWTSHEIHIDQNGDTHVHDNVDEVRYGNSSWDDSHRPTSDIEVDIIKEVEAREGGN